MGLYVYLVYLRDACSPKLVCHRDAEFNATSAGQRKIDDVSLVVPVQVQSKHCLGLTTWKPTYGAVHEGVIREDEGEMEP